MRTFVIVTMLLLTACASQDAGTLVSDTSEAGGESLTRVRIPVSLTATRPGLSTVGKDYLFASPVNVSGMGQPQNYLWFGVGSTIDRYLTGAEDPQLTSIVLLIDDVPMTFDLIPWADAANYSPYDLPVKTHASYGAKITRSQIRTIAAANDLQAYVTNAEFRSPTFTISDGSLNDWLTF